MRNFLILVTTLYAVVQAYVVLERQWDSQVIAAPSFGGVDQKSSTADASDEVCATGCSVGNHPIVPLTSTELKELFEHFSTASGKERESALDTLLFHGHQSRGQLDAIGSAFLVPEQLEFLRRELSKTHARVWMRVVDDRGVVRAGINGHRFPIGIKEHAHVENTMDLPAPEISGTVHRTGLHHLWTRI